MRTLVGFGILGILIGALPDPVSYFVLVGFLLTMSVMLYTSTQTLIQRRKDAIRHDRSRA